MPFTLTNARRIWIRVALSAILAAQIGYALSLHPLNFFGWSGDDSIYFSSAKALAEGKGYILPSVPGTPRATKYPVLYPWLLSWVWRLNSTFPSNLSAAVAMNLVFGGLFSILAFLFFRQLKTLSDSTALLLTAFCAMHPLILFYTGNVVTDVPFAALALGAMVLAERAIEAKSGIWEASSCGIVSGFAVLMRTLGAPVAAGLCFVMLLRRRWRESIAYAFSVAPFFGATIWRSVFSVPQKPPSVTTSCAKEWQNTWLYYTSYPSELAASFASHTFWHNVKANLTACLLQPGMYFFEAPAAKYYYLGLILVALLAAISLRGLIRQIQTRGWHPIFFVLGIYLLPVLIWDYPSSDRFLLPFLPLFGAGVALESTYLLAQIRLCLKSNKSEEKRTALCFSLAGVVLLGAVSFSWWWGINFLKKKSEERGMLLLEKRQAYDWLRVHTTPDARFISWEDATVYLYSGRQGMGPTLLLPGGIYRSEILDADISCLGSTATPIGASYWLISDDDFGLRWESAVLRARSKEAETSKSLELVFASQQRHVRIYALPRVDRPVI